MRGLALEGGGARGAYHIGVVKALMEKGYVFDGFVGTSIGAINAAVLAQGDFDLALELWMNISMEQIFNIEEQFLFQVMDMKSLRLDASLPSGLKKAITKAVSGKGISTEKIKVFLEKYIDEERIRKSGKDFGLVTVSLSEKKPYELMLCEIPNGQLIDYIMASACFPGFRPVTIGENKYLDGGIYNNCPVNLLAAKGYEEIIAVRTQAFGLVPKMLFDKNVKTISARKDLGKIMLFTPENSAANIKLGYYDGLRFTDNLRGMGYYIKPVDADEFNARLIALDDDVILKTGEILGVPEMNAKRMLFEKIIPQLGAYMKLGKDNDYADFIIALLEYAAAQRDVHPYQVYDFEQLCIQVRKAETAGNRKKLLEKIPINHLLAKKQNAAEFLCGYLLGV